MNKRTKKIIVLIVSIAGFITLVAFLRTAFEPSKPIVSPEATASPEQPGAQVIPLRKTLRGQSGQVFSTAISKDGKFLVSGSNDNTIRIWNIDTGELQRTINSPSSVESLVISPDSQTLSSAGWGATDSIALWQTSTGKLLRNFQGQSFNVTALAISPDGQTLVSADSESAIKLWNLGTGELKKTIAGAHSGGISTIAVSSDGRFFASGSRQGTIKVWTLDTGEEKFSLPGHGKKITSLAFTSDMQKLVSGGADNTIKIWNLTNRELLGPLTGHTNEITSIAMSADGQTFASAGRDGIVKTWNINDGQLTSTYRLSAYADEFVILGVDQTKKFLANGYVFNTIKIWSLP